ncbi:glycoside hydrolase family 17 protein [Aliarcobacter lanthieri]|uniref:glycoside hydrolase family 17 protein n=1 Tax=Aliarcobacter lanthieri TaxID=1355374 RepID=UPI0004B4D759|nr:glycosyl hydrolase [Aliarcobacter lanthieri]
MNTNKLFLIFCSAIIALFFWHYLGEKAILKDETNSFDKLQCVSYAPYGKDESPFLFDKGLVLKEENIRKDMELLSKYTSCVRTYSTVGQELIPKVAKDLNMQVLMGIWIGKEEKQAIAEIAKLKELAAQYPEVIKAIIVGNEVLLRGDTTENQLAKYIKEVKEALPQYQVTYADVWEYWLKYPKIKELTDFVTIHILPYWEDDPKNIHDSIEHIKNVRLEVEKELGTSNILIGETGWPSEGRIREDAQPSKINQAKYIRDFVSLANEHNWQYNIIEAIDQPWKRISEGAVGGFWGIFDKDRADKNVFSGDVSNFPNYLSLAFGSLVLILGFFLIFRKEQTSTIKLIIFSAVNTIFSILFMLQVEQYIVISRNYLEAIWAILLLGVQIYVYYQLLKHIICKNQYEIISKVAFYLSAISIFIMIVKLAYNGRYENFEIYGLSILAISFIWSYIGNFDRLKFGNFERLFAIILLINTFVMIYSETTMNIFSNILAIISFIFVAILYLGSIKNGNFEKLKKPILYIIVTTIALLLFKNGLIMNNSLGMSCKENGGILCSFVGYIWYLLYFNYIGTAAIIASIVAFLINTRVFVLIALFLSILASMLTNTFLGAIAFIIVMYVITKDSDKKLLD